MRANTIDVSELITDELAWKNGLSEEPEEHQKFKQWTVMGTPLVEVIDLFCGGGGFSEGAKQAGARVVLAVDNWEPALTVHHANHPEVETLQLELGGSIVETAVILRERLTKGSHFHLHGSPPCQALSNASNTDPAKGMRLVNWFLELVDYMKPDSWSMENVKPVAKRLPEGTPWVYLNAADFGVPQTRERTFAGTGWKAQATHDSENWISVIEALPDLQGELEMTTNANIRQRTVNEPMRTITSKTPGQTRFKLEALGANANRKSDREVSKPSKTICGSGNQVGARVFDHVANPPVRIRSLTLEETMILQGFPRGYLMPYRKKADAWVIVGNAVCPPVARAIVEGIL